MELKRLSLAHVRAFTQAEFNFQPGMNLLVGINGAGKTTVLDVLRIMMSQTLPKFTASRSKPLEFDKDSDISIGQGALTAELHFEAARATFEHLIHLPRAAYVIDKEQKGTLREQTYDLLSRNEFRLTSGPGSTDYYKHSLEQSLVVYFSTHRSFPSMAAPSKASSAGKQAAAFAESLSHRQLRIREFAEWWLVQETLAQEREQSPQQTLLFDGANYNEYRRRLEALQTALSLFLENCTNLRAVSEPETTLLVDKVGKTLDIRMLSDGERSMIALVLDLARRLTVANPSLENPLSEGKAVVLIDELDLHLHPRWQRTIANRLTQTFPNCQFIATTHSPQIIGGVPPDKIILIDDRKVTRPDQSLGMDSNWILTYLMKAAERDEKTEEQLQQIEDLIEAERYEEATAQIDLLRQKVGEFPDLVSLQARVDMILFLSEDDEDDEE
jgi:predicted ATP-binding protein involved in virulence